MSQASQVGWSNPITGAIIVVFRDIQMQEVESGTRAEFWTHMHSINCFTVFKVIE